MKVTVNIKGKDTEIELTPEQINQVEKLNQKVTDRIKTFEDVLEDNNISELDFKNSCNGLSEDEIAYKQIKLIVKSLNKGWNPDWNNRNEYKYYPYFNMESGGFSRANSYLWITFTYVGSRLCYSSGELAEYAGTKFNSIYEKFIK